MTLSKEPKEPTRDTSSLQVPVYQDALLPTEAFSSSTCEDIQQDAITKLIGKSKDLATHSPSASASASKHRASPDDSGLSERGEGSCHPSIPSWSRSDATSQLYGTGSETDSVYSREGEDGSFSVNIESKFPVALIGFGRYEERDEDPRFVKGSIDFSLTSSADPGNVVCRLPWGGYVSAYGYLGDTKLTLPAFAVVVGFAKSLEDLSPVGSEVHRIPFDRDVVKIEDSRFYGLTHIAFRNAAEVQLTRCIARRTAMVHGNSTFRQVCEAGPTIADGKSAAFVDSADFRSILSRDDSPNVIITSKQHRLVHKKELKSSTIHPVPLPTDPFVIDGIKERIKYSRVHQGDGILVRVRYLPWVLFLLGFVLWVLPGVIQWLGGEDRNWASICNQIIGTGSVLLGLVIYTARKLFTHAAFRFALTGEVILHNDGAARFFAPQLIKTLKIVACDPRLSEKLIAEDGNSAVRVNRSGWLRIGRRIPVKEAHRHWYHVLLDKGVVLDLLEARIYKLKTTNDGNEVILRHRIDGTADEEWTSHFVREDAVLV